MQQAAASRTVPWPRDVRAVAHSLATAGDWCWLDGDGSLPDELTQQSVLGSARAVLTAQRGGEREFLAGLRAEMQAGTSAAWVVALSYEFGVALLGLPPAEDTAAPGFALALSTVLVLDHATQRAELRGASEADLDAWIARHGAALRQPYVASYRAPAQHAAGRTAQWRRTPQEYRSQVEACRAAIADGEAYVLCLTDRATVTGAAVDPLRLYLAVRTAGESARGGVIVAGDRALVSASPERFLSVHAGELSTHPIKGTRPRGNTPDSDARLAAELRNDPKEQAENLMIVDLMRNDLSRVCDPASVETRGFLRVESHPHVHQLVSTVAGRLLPGYDALDALQVCFPGGSMTGAPKRRAVEILGALEDGPRGLYSGCFGWLDASGDAELAMTIRCVEVRGLDSATATAVVGAGGGITADSDPASEEAERRLKADPLLSLLTA